MDLTTRACPWLVCVRLMDNIIKTFRRSRSTRPRWSVRRWSNPRSIVRHHDLFISQQRGKEIYRTASGLERQIVARRSPRVPESFPLPMEASNSLSCIPSIKIHSWNTIPIEKRVSARIRLSSPNNQKIFKSLRYTCVGTSSRPPRFTKSGARFKSEKNCRKSSIDPARGILRLEVIGG